MPVDLQRTMHRPAWRRPAWRPLALAAASLCLPPLSPTTLAAPALPSGLQVVQGQATVQTHGSAMTVSNSANALLNWQQFSIGAGQSVHFAQPSATSKVLNRVVGAEPSAILGSLSSNGQVWLLNPQGVLFGAGARVDVAGLVASTLHIADSDWQAGRLRLTGSADGVFGGAVVNQGELRSLSGGQLLLIGSGSVRNEGLIEAPDGQVLLAAGQRIELIDSAVPRLAYTLTAPAGEVLNLGRLQAGGGRIDLQAALVNQQGIVRADGLANGPGGSVLISGSQGVQLSAPSHTSASGGSGGSVQVDGGSGSLLASGSIAATGATGLGGQITLLGRQVGLLDGARVDASGASGGGAVRVGGGVQGRDAAFRQAEASYLAPGASLLADATANGDGGLVVLWGDRASRAYGSLSARGGPAGGNGGLVETSGGWLDARPASLRTDAPAGQAGHWLIDPEDIVIQSGGYDYDISSGPDFTSTGGSSTLSSATLEKALNANNNVSVTTSSAGEGRGDILLSSVRLQPTPTAPVSLTLNALGGIRIADSTLRSLGAPMSLVLQAGLGGGEIGGSATGNRLGGTAFLINSAIDTRGGDILIGGPSVPCGPVLGCLPAQPGAVAGPDGLRADGIALFGVSLDAGSGRIALSGHSLMPSGQAAGVGIHDSSSLRAAQIDVLGTVDAAPLQATGYGEQRGVLIADSSLSASQGLSIQGQAAVATDQGFISPVGVAVVGNSSLTIGQADGSPTASLRIDGQAVVSMFGNQPQLVSGTGTRLSGAELRLVALGGAAMALSGADLSPEPGRGLSVDSSALPAIDATQGSSLTLQSPGSVWLSGQIRLPEAGVFSVEAGKLLAIERADISGNARQVKLQGETLNLGSSSGQASLVFGDDTRVQLSAGVLTLGNVGDVFDTAQQVPSKQALHLQQAQGLTPPSTPVVLASGGPMRIDASEIVIGDNATLYSAAPGTAISLGGVQPGENLARFVNHGSGGVLQAPNGRWLVFAQDSHASDGSFQPGALQPGFLQYGARRDQNAAAQGDNGFLFGVAPQLGLQGPGTVSRVYDGGTALVLGATDPVLSGLLPGHALAGALAFADKQVGNAKALRPTTGTGGHSVVTEAGVPVYGYGFDEVSLRGSITPAPLSLASVSVASKVYDGTTSASVSGWTLAGVLPNDDVRVLSGSGQFSSAGAGSSQPVSVLVASLTGADAGNYQTSGLSLQSRAAILPATLVYNADAAVAVIGQPLPALGGTVTGLVTGDSLASATQGVLRFTADLPANPAPGPHAIVGSGLSAVNYGFVQAPGNATALTLQAPPPPPGTEQITRPVNPFVTVAALSAVRPPARPSTVDDGRLLDVLSALRADSGGPVSFAALDLDRLPAATVAALLAARDAYKQAVFQQALLELERNPAAADAAGCANAQQAANGQCLLVASPSAGLDISNARVITQLPSAKADPRPAIQPAPPLSTAPTAPTAPASTAPSAATAPPVAAPSPAPSLPAQARLPALPADVSVQLPPRRTVLQAALPQIQRKIALLIGIDQYRDTRIPQLSNAVADARAVAAAFESRLGYETLVLENASRATIFRALNLLSAQVGPADSVVLYYAGHGDVLPSSGLGFWQPADADAQRPETWISNADIDRVLRQLPASQVAMISDSCFSGSLVSGDRIRGVSATQDPATLLGRRAAVVMTSGGNEPVFDSGANGHSPFANGLMQSLKQVGNWKPGSNLFEQVRFAVARKLPQRPQYGAARDAGHEQGADYVFEQRQLRAPAQ